MTGANGGSGQHTARPSRIGAAAFALLLSLAAPNEASAQQSSTIAEALFRDGIRLLEEDRVAEACDKFAASQRVEPALGTLLNLAVCHEKQGKTATAWAEYAEIVSLARRAGDADREKFAKERVAALEKVLHRAIIELRFPVPGIEVVLNGQTLDRAVLGTGIPLDPGEHSLEVRAPGKKPWMRRIALGPSSSMDRIEVPPLEDEGAPEAAAPASEPNRAPLREAAPMGPQPAPADQPSEGGVNVQRTVGYVVGGLGVVGLGTAIAFGISSAGHASDRDAVCAGGEICSEQAAFDAHRDAEIAQQWMFVTGGIGLAALGAGIALVLTSSSDDEPNTVATPLVGPGGGGLLVRGAF